jgi:hypothetical protein
MLLSSHRVSSACAGALTSDMALAVVEKTVNDSGFFSRLCEVSIDQLPCDSSLNNHLVIGAVCLAMCIHSYTCVSLFVDEMLRKSTLDAGSSL